MDLDNVNISKAISAKNLDKKLSGLKWITPQYPENPGLEISRLNEVIKILKKDKSNKVIVTDYQFISVIMSIYDNSPNKVWYSFHIYPTKENKYFSTYQNFFINKIKEKKIKSIYIVGPLYGDKNILKDILDEKCFNKVVVTEMLEKHLLRKCNQL
tara:strand:- start:308 stop:775 length:468 start_codon:yes stop_codon:yes gene_type:complete